MSTFHRPRWPLLIGTVLILIGCVVYMSLPGCASTQSAYRTRRSRLVYPEPMEILPSHAEARVIVVDPHAGRGQQ